MSANSSTRGNATSNRLCYCRRRATIQTARTARNKGRLFYTCPLPQVSNVNGVFCILIFVQDWTWVFCVVQQDTDRCNFFLWVDEDIDVGATEIGRIESIPDFGLRLRPETLQREVRSPIALLSSPAHSGLQLLLNFFPYLIWIAASGTMVHFLQLTSIYGHS